MTGRSTDLGDGLPAAPVAGREFRAFDGVQVSRHRFEAGEFSVEGFDGHLVTLHLRGPVSVLNRVGGDLEEAIELDGDVATVPAHTPAGQASRPLPRT